MSEYYVRSNDDLRLIFAVMFPKFKMTFNMVWTKSMYFFQLGFTSSKTEQPLRGKELQEKEAQID